MPMGLVFSHIYMLPWKAAARKAEQVAGRKLVALAFRKAGSRLAGKLLTGSREWTKAFEHIAEHFTEEALLHKASHSVFRASLRSRALLEPLLKDAVTKPSRKVISQLRLHGENLGRVCVIIEREFATAIGEDITQSAGGELIKRPAKILRVVIDITGRPITAFPVAEFFSYGRLRDNFVEEVSDDDLQALENVIIPEVREAYAEESRYAAAHIQANIERGRSWIQEALTWVPYIDSVFDEETGPQAAASDIVPEARVAIVIRNIEIRLGLTLDSETRDHIRLDVFGIWGFATTGPPG